MMEATIPCTECEHLREEDGYCLKANFNPIIANGCSPNHSFTPKSKEKTQCQIEGCIHAIDDGCTHAFYIKGWKFRGQANCGHFDKGEKKMEKHNYLTRDGVNVTTAEQILSLDNVWDHGPCSDEFSAMCKIFMDAGYNFTDEIPFTQTNLNLLSRTAFNWLIAEDFLAIVKEVTIYRDGQWFKDGLYKYFILRSNDRNKYFLIYAGGLGMSPSFCVYDAAIPMEASTEEGLSNLIAKHWPQLSPIASPEF